ncbi:MAG: hypothetical protein GY913_28380 [Proteobacteria bacterium]|nr:hypothetical protein [Pseudomonadota bacterium]
MKETVEPVTVLAADLEAALQAGATRLVVPDATDLSVLAGRPITWLSLAGSPIEHTELRNLAGCPLVHLDLSRTSLVALEPIRRALEARPDDMTARMVIAEVWAERYEFRWARSPEEGGYGDFYIEDDDPADIPQVDDDPIEALGEEDLVAVEVPDHERMAALLQASELYDLDLRALHGPLTGLGSLPRTLRVLQLLDTPVADAELEHLDRLPDLQLLNLAGTAITQAPTGSSLRALDLSGTRATGPYPPELQGLRTGRGLFSAHDLPTTLESLAVVDATLEPDSLTRLPPGLQQLTCYRCELNAAGTWALGGLQDVDLTRCRLSQADRAGLGALGTLSSLRLSRTDLTAEDLPLLAGLVDLPHLAIGFMEIEPVELEKLHDLLPNTVVELAYEES